MNITGIAVGQRRTVQKTLYQQLSILNRILILQILCYPENSSIFKSNELDFQEKRVLLDYKSGGRVRQGKHQWVKRVTLEEGGGVEHISSSN